MNNALLKSAIIATAVTVSAFGFAEIANAATFNYFDGTFNDSDWTRAFQATGSPSSETAEQRPSGGNPDGFRFMTHTWGNGVQGAVFHLNKNAVYDPSTQGAIESLDYSADVIGFNTSSGVFGDGLLLQQDGRLFISQFTAVRFPSSWQTKSASDLTSSSFLSLDGGAAPDFSATGDRIAFGYIRTNTIPGAGTTIAHGIDNWSVSVTNISTASVPEADFVLGLLALASFGITSTLQRQREQK
jgi:hypothetical protein